MVKVTLTGNVADVESALGGPGPVFEDLFIQTLGGFPARRPIGISSGAWFYERKHGIAVVIEARSKDGMYATTVQAFIPWKTVERSVKRFQREQRRQKSIENKKAIRQAWLERSAHEREQDPR